MKKKYKVGELAKILKNLIEDFKPFQRVNVEGEISNFKEYRKTKSQITYFFNLKDDNASISCVSFSQKLFASKRFRDGDKVVAFGRITYFSRDGKITFMVTNVQKVGLGDLYLEYERIKRLLRIEGCFDRSKKKEIPVFPENIGVITAITSAACADVRRTIKRRCKFRKVVYFDTTVQGDTAPKSIIYSLKCAEKYNLDVILICRGGGSFEDLFCFSDEKVVRQIAKMKTPIVTGIGHEVDTSLADLASDLRCSTPTAAAEAITYVTEELIAYIDRISIEMNNQIVNLINNLYDMGMRDLKSIEINLANRLKRSTEKQKNLSHQINREIFYKISHLKQSYTNIKKILDQNRFKNLIFQDLKVKSKNLLTYINTISFSFEKKINDVKLSWKNNTNLLIEASPNKILKRGYAIIKDEKNKIITSIQDVHIDDQIDIKMDDGIIISKVKKTTTNNGGYDG